MSEPRCNWAEGYLVHPDHLAAGPRARMLEHLRSCKPCLRVALRSDPTLVFTLQSTAEIEESEIASLRHTVRSLRRCREIETRPGRFRGLAGRSVAAAGLVAGLLLLIPTQESHRPEADVPGSLRPQVERESLNQQMTGFGTLPPMVQESPIVEGLNRPQARIYQLDEDDLSVVMVVDESLDL